MWKEHFKKQQEDEEDEEEEEEKSLLSVYGSAALPQLQPAEEQIDQIEKISPPMLIMSCECCCSEDRS